MSPSLPRRSPLDGFRAHPRLADAVLAAVLAGGTLAGLFTQPLIDYPFRSPDATAMVLSLLATLPVAARRIQPLAVLAITGLATAAFSITGYWSAFVGLGLLCMIYTVAVRQELRIALAGAAYALVIVWVTLALDGTRDSIASYFANTLTLLIAFFIGRNVRTRRAYTEALEERARLAEEERESLARQAVYDERRRIARELHDVVAHNISVMGVLAAGARRALARDPMAATEETLPTLATIEETGRSTLREMRHLLDVLRVDEEPEDSPTSPQPGVGTVAALVEQVREAGLPVTLTVDGAPRPLPSGVDLSAYRIVQEALTNALKHAGPTATAGVRLRYAHDALVIDVVDNGRGAASGRNETVHGHGLVGMRERVALFGGTLRTGTRAGGGYAVHARLPLDAPGSGGLRPVAAEATAVVPEQPADGPALPGEPPHASGEPLPTPGAAQRAVS